LDSLTNIIAANHKDQADWQIITAGKKGPVSMAVINALAAPLVRPAFDGVAYKYALGELVMLLGSGSIGTVTSRRKDGTIGVRWLSYAGELPACTNMARHEVAPLFVVGDRVMYTSSTSEDQRVRNGDRGVVLAIDTKAMVVTVQYEGVDVPIAHAMDDLHTRVQLAYAITVHKYQGNEAQHVIVVVHASHGTRLATQNLLYTAVTRGRKKVTAFCCPEVFKRCMMNKVQRNTYLRAVLIG
jgi:ATP-dependent exoDNAse (exonuclease V) alpha subunit